MDEGNPRDTDAPDSAPDPEPPKAPLDEPEAAAAAEKRLTEEVPLGILFISATGALMLFLALVAAAAYFALSPEP